jgi:hypothetical protein
MPATPAAKRLDPAPRSRVCPLGVLFESDFS